MENNIFEMKKNKNMMTILYLYAHADTRLVNLVDLHFVPLKRSPKIEVWSDSMIDAGEEWDSEIKTKLEKADIILLFVSPSFNASEYVWNVELKRAIERHDRKECVVIPIFIRYCDFKYMPYAKIQGFPSGGRFIYNCSKKAQDFLCLEIVDAVRRIIDKLSPSC